MRGPGLGGRGLRARPQGTGRVSQWSDLVEQVTGHSSRAWSASRTSFLDSCRLALLLPEAAQLGIVTGGRVERVEGWGASWASTVRS